MNRGARGKVIPLRDENAVEADGSPDQVRRMENGASRANRNPFPVVSTLPRLPVMIPDEISGLLRMGFLPGRIP